jgi:hypothetical protein
VGSARSWRRAGTAAVIFAVLTASAAAAQEPSPSPVPRFEGAARLVTVDVVVTDASGRPVRDLTQGDFRVYEDGRPRPLARFDPPPRGRVKVPASPNAGPKLVPAHRAASLVMVLDDEHLTVGEGRGALKLVKGLLCQGLAEDDRATLVVVSTAEWWSAVGDAACTDLAPRLDGLRGQVLSPHDDELSGPG